MAINEPMQECDQECKQAQDGKRALTVNTNSEEGPYNGVDYRIWTREQSGGNIL